MRVRRRSQLRSSRGHVRLDKQPSKLSPQLWWGAVAAVVVIVAIILARQGDSKKSKKESVLPDNRTWLEFTWANDPISADSVQRLGEHLKGNQMNMVYLEALAWRSDGSFVEGAHAADFVQSLHSAYPEVKILLWLRLSGDQIADETTQDLMLKLADKAVNQWKMDGVQVNGRGVLSGNPAYADFLRALRDTIGTQSLLSVTVPPDRIPTDPDIPIGPATEPGLTWDLAYKQRIGLLPVDEIVVMAHASGLEDPKQYETWTAYQVESYADILSELEHPAKIVIAVPTYDTEPYHDPAVETVENSILGVKDGIKQAGKHGKLVQGIGLYEYKTTDSLEWSQYRQYWLGLK